MKIALDSGPLKSGHKVRGVGFYTKNLIDSLGKRVEAVDFEKTDLNKYDIIHIPYFNPFFVNVPFGVKPKIVITIHDTIPLIYPKVYKPGLRGGINLFINKLLLKKVSAVITLSETSKKDIVRLLGVPAEKIHPIYLAPGVEFKKLETKDTIKTKEKYKLPDKFVLYVGDINYNKNIPGLVKACKLIKLPLVIIGKQAGEIKNQDLNHAELKHLKNLDWSEVIKLGFVSDDDLTAIFNLTSVYCQPSFYEGFGLPILQAMACETPVVAARTQALVEIGEPACLFADPKNPKDLAEKIDQVIRDRALREQLINTGHVLVKNYSWEKTARETLDIYTHV